MEGTGVCGFIKDIVYNAMSKWKGERTIKEKEKERKKKKRKRKIVHNMVVLTEKNVLVLAKIFC